METKQSEEWGEIGTY